MPWLDVSEEKRVGLTHWDAELERKKEEKKNFFLNAHVVFVHWNKPFLFVAAAQSRRYKFFRC